MDPQGSTPDITAGGTSHSLPSSADNTGVSQPSTPQEPQNGDLLGRLQYSQETGTPVTETPSQPTPETTTPQAEPENQGQQPTGDSVETTLEVDPELARWASSQNLTLNTQAEITLAKRLRDTQTALHQAKNQKFQEVQQTSDDEFADPVEQKVSAVEARLARFDFFEANPEAKALEPKMVEFVLDLQEKGDLQAASFYASNWTHLYNAVKSQAPAPDPGEFISQGQQIERENLARVQQAAPPRAAATSSAPQPQLNEEETIAKMSPAEYDNWRKTHNPFRA